MNMKYVRHGKEYRKDERESTEDEDVYSTRHRLYEVECPECGSQDIEVLWWEEEWTSIAKAVCDCGFEHREEFSNRDIVPEGGGGPLEHVMFEVEGSLDKWWGSWEFSPRLFLKMIEDDGETPDKSSNQK